MRRMYQLFVFLLFAALLSFTCWTLFGDTLNQRALRPSGQGDGRILAAVEDGGSMYVLHEEEDLTQSLLSASGKLVDRDVCQGLPQGFRLEQFLVHDGRMLVSGYEKTQAGGLDLCIYTADSFEQSFRVVLQEDCTGWSTSEQKAAAICSAFSVVDGNVCFFVQQDGIVTIYRTEGDGLAIVENFAHRGAVHSGIVTTDGSVYLVSTMDELLLFDHLLDKAVLVETGKVYSNLAAMSDGGFQYVNAATGETLRYTPGSGSSVQNSAAKSASGASWISLYEGGSVFIADGRLLRATDDGAVQDITDGLYPDAMISALLLAGAAFLMMLLAFVLTYVFAVAANRFFPILLRSFLVFCLLAGVGGQLLMTVFVVPSYVAALREPHMTRMGEAAVILAQTGYTPEHEAMSSVLPPDAQAAVLRQEGSDYIVITATDVNIPDGARLASAGMPSQLSEMARGDWYISAVALYPAYYAGVARGPGGQIYVVYKDAGAAEAGIAHHIKALSQTLSLAAAIAVAVGTILVAFITRGIKRLQQGATVLSGGNTDVRIVQRSGDELENLAGSLNGLAQSLGRSDEGEEQQRHAYLQFVPKGVISLMGAERIDEVTKQTTASKQMAVMDVNIRFPAHLYRGDPRVLFEKMNEVIERTSAVLTRHGGTIYNFTSEGYDAVFPNETQAAVSAAVEMRQEILALNQESEGAGGEPVELRIALDWGNIIMGVVGDEGHMVPTAISACLDVTKSLLALAELLDANILCTMPVAKEAEGYRSRYIGKAKDGDGAIRVYELFDGDPYPMRMAKEKNRNQFSEGVLTLYTGEYSKAKRIFMDIARYYSMDGITRHYLYLADKYEQEAPERIILE